MKYNFDRVLDRKGTRSIKWEYIVKETGVFELEKTKRFYGKDRDLPMWIADMDFESPRPVVEALTRRAQHGLYGYTHTDESYSSAIIGWMRRRHGWNIKKEWICVTPGVVSALAMLVRTFVKPGEKIVIQPPVYRPFYMVADFNKVGIAKNRLIYKDGRYKMDFEDLARKCRDPKVKMLILCNPHNPVGRVWSRSELLRLGEICLKNNVLVVSDDIHEDLIYKGHKFVPFARISKEFAMHSITCTAPSKTFNLAGLSTSNIIIPDPILRARFQSTLLNNALLDVGIFGSLALETAYNRGEEWLDQVMDYLAGNLAYLESYLQEKLPQIKAVHPEGTYLVWLDCRALGLDQAALKRLFDGKAGVHLEQGTVFGEEGEGFVRMNIACRRAILKDALARIRRAIET